MKSLPFFAIKILRRKSGQFATCASVCCIAACSDRPFVRSDSYKSSRCAASSTWTSSFSADSNARPERRWLTSLCQSAMGHLRQPAQSVEQLRPFLPNRGQLFLPLGGQAITTAAPAIAAGFPGATNPASLLQAVQHGVERREGESQRAFGLLLDAPRQLIAVKRRLFQNAENGQFRRASFDSRSNHSALPYI